MRNILMFIMILIICGSCGAVVLIDQNTRNGSFETGQWNPWSVHSGLVLINDPLFASDGLYYIKLATTTGREHISQGKISTEKNIGSVFIFPVDVRNGVNPFDQLDVWVGGRTYDGEFVYGAEYNMFDIPAEAANTWVTITGTKTFSAADWQELDVSTLSFGIQFSKDNWINGELLEGFLDNVVLMQIPEPMSVLLFGLGILALKRRV